MENITVDEIKEHWGDYGYFGSEPAYLSFLAEILNGEKSVEEARSDILSFRENTQPASGER